LDLAIVCEQEPLSISLLADLRQSFEDSSLPYKVDIVDMNSIAPEFLDIINEQKVLWDFKV
jgi:hypothetical protein